MKEVKALILIYLFAWTMALAIGAQVVSKTPPPSNASATAGVRG